jgi:hypothetical protein
MGRVSFSLFLKPLFLLKLFQNLNSFETLNITNLFKIFKSF